MYFKKQSSKRKTRKKGKRDPIRENNLTFTSKVDFKLNFISLFFVLLLIFYIVTDLSYFTFYILNFDLNELVGLISTDKYDLINFSVDSTVWLTREPGSNFGLDSTLLKILSL